MTINVQCNSCGKSYAANESLAGKQVQCPGCGKPLRVIAVSSNRTAAARSTHAVVCGGCGAGFSAGENLWGKSVQCPQCSTMISIPVPQSPAASSASGFDDPFAGAAALESAGSAQPSPLSRPLAGGSLPPAQRKRRGLNLRMEMGVPQLLLVYAIAAVIGAAVSGLVWGKPFLGAGFVMLVMGGLIGYTARLVHFKENPFGNRESPGYSPQVVRTILLGIGLSALGVVVAGVGYVANEFKFEGKYFNERVEEDADQN